MGCTISPEQKEAQLKNKKIEKELRKVHDNQKLTVKILLLGAGESGKSTILKQMKIIHQKGYSAEEMEDFKIILRGNITNFFEILISVAKKQPESIFSEEETQCAAKISEFALKANFSSLPQEIADSMKIVWKNENFQKLMEKPEAGSLNLALKKLVIDVDRLASSDYVPTEDDILLSRVKTTGIKQLDFEYKGTNFIICDVGGQRSERRKWIHAFEGVDAIIFFVAISEFDQMLEEDEKTNRMQESLNLFDSVLNQVWFKNSSIILFLNKTDLFEMKIKYSDFKKFFPDFEGNPSSVEETQDYLKRKFENLNKSLEREIYTHFTNATRTDQMSAVFESVTDMILRKNLKDYGLC